MTGAVVLSYEAREAATKQPYRTTNLGIWDAVAEFDDEIKSISIPRTTKNSNINSTPYTLLAAYIDYIGVSFYFAYVVMFCFTLR